MNIVCVSCHHTVCVAVVQPDSLLPTVTTSGQRSHLETMSQPYGAKLLKSSRRPRYNQQRCSPWSWCETDSGRTLTIQCVRPKTSARIEILNQDFSLKEEGGCCTIWYFCFKWELIHSVRHKNTFQLECEHSNSGVIYCTVVFLPDFIQSHLQMFVFFKNIVTICNFCSASLSLQMENSFCFPSYLGCFVICRSNLASFLVLSQASYDRWYI